MVKCNVTIVSRMTLRLAFQSQITIFMISFVCILQYAHNISTSTWHWYSPLSWPCAWRFLSTHLPDYILLEIKLRLVSCRFKFVHWIEASKTHNIIMSNEHNKEKQYVGNTNGYGKKLHFSMQARLHEKIMCMVLNALYSFLQINKT